jgi:hypothetical protein
MRLPSSSTVALSVGILGSGAANVAWTYELGPVRIAAGLFATALVPISLHLWPRVPVTGGWTRAIRAIVMTYICLAAAVVNLAHSSLLLTTDLSVPRSATEEPWLAILLITAVEAVMVMATLAKRTRPAMSKEQAVALLVAVGRLISEQPATASRQTSRRTSRQQTADTTVGAGGTAPDTPTGTAPDTPDSEQKTTNRKPKRTLSAVPSTDRFADFEQWVQTLGERPSGKQIRDRYGCGYTKSQELLESLDDEEEAV